MRLTKKIATAAVAAAMSITMCTSAFANYAAVYTVGYTVKGTTQFTTTGHDQFKDADFATQLGVSNIRVSSNTSTMRPVLTITFNAKQAPVGLAVSVKDNLGNTYTQMSAPAYTYSKTTGVITYTVRVQCDKMLQLPKDPGELAVDSIDITFSAKNTKGVKLSTTKTYAQDENLPYYAGYRKEYGKVFKFYTSNPTTDYLKGEFVTYRYDSSSKTLYVYGGTHCGEIAKGILSRYTDNNYVLKCAAEYVFRYASTYGISGTINKVVTYGGVTAYSTYGASIKAYTKANGTIKFN